MRDGRPKTGLDGEVTTGFEDSDNVAMRSGSEGAGAGDERALVFCEGMKFGSDGNLWLVVVSRRRMEGGCCKRSTIYEPKRI